MVGSSPPGRGHNEANGEADRRGHRQTGCRPNGSKATAATTAPPHHPTTAMSLATPRTWASSGLVLPRSLRERGDPTDLGAHASGRNHSTRLAAQTGTAAE
jgi:hypothetical protein